MLEHALAELFEQQAWEDAPPMRSNIPSAVREGRRRWRRRSAGVIAAPVFAAGAVLAIALVGTIPGSAGHQPATTGHHPQVVPRHFNPLRPYVWYGWLPGGASTKVEGLFGRDNQILYGPGPSTARIMVDVFAAGRCQVRRALLMCAETSGPRQQIPNGGLGSKAGQVDGHPAYWTPQTKSGFPRSVNPTKAGTLIWQYARGSWAILSAPDKGDGLRIARNLIFGPTAGPPISFPFQLTDVPASWQVNSVATGWHDGVQYASSFVITAGPVDAVPLGVYPSATPLFDAGPATGKQSSCAALMYYQHRTETINGYPAYVGFSPRATWPESELCTADADGQMAWLAMGRHPTISAVNLFAHHMRLLGPDPANWTTRPIG
jgi:hypothetical protein